MKAYYPVDATGNRIGLKTPEAAIYDASGTNLTTKINNINSGISNRYTKSEVDSKVTNLQNSINSKYSATGGTLNGDITFPDIGDSASSKGINWSGSTDGARIYYKTTAKDAGHLVLQVSDDANAVIDFEWSGNGSGTKAYITNDGVYHGKATSASYADSAGSANSVAWGNVSGKPATYAPSSHTHTIAQVTNLQSSLDGKAAKSHTHAIGDISNLQNTINSINSNISNKYSSSGGILNGDLRFPDVGDTGSSKGINWGGGNDGARIYYKTTAKDNGHLVLQMSDDGTESIDIEWKMYDGTISRKAWISSDGVYHGTATNATTAGSANSVAWGNVSGKPATYAPSSHTHTIAQVTNLQSTLDGKAAKSHTHGIGDISNLQNTINTINSNKADKSSFTNAGYNSWVVIRNDGTVGAKGTYPTSGYTELIVVLRYSDSNQTEFHSIPCVDGSPWFAYSKTNGCYMGKGDIHDAKSANFTKYGVYFNTTGQFAAGSLTGVYIYGRKKLW